MHIANAKSSMPLETFLSKHKITREFISFSALLCLMFRDIMIKGCICVANKNREVFSYINQDKRKSNFMYKDFEKSNSYHTNFSECDFSFASLRAAKFRFCSFYGATFVRTEFIGTNLCGSNFTNAVFRDCIFKAAILDGANFCNAIFENTLFIGTNFMRAKNLSESESGIRIITRIPSIKEFSNELIDIVDNLRKNDILRRSNTLHLKRGAINTINLALLLETYTEEELMKAFIILPVYLTTQFHTLSYLERLLNKLHLNGIM